MGSHGRHAVVLEHLFAIAMVGSDEGDAPHLAGGFHHLSHATIHRLHRQARSFVDAGMPDHIAVGEVEDDDIIVAAFNPFHAGSSYFVGGHIRLHVIGSHLRRWDEHTILSGEHSFHAAIEEEGHMGILFRLCNAQLGQPQLGDVLPKDIFQCFTGVGHFHVGHTGIVTSGADELKGEKALFPLKSVKVRIHQGAGDLPCPIRTKVHENHGVIGLDLRILYTDHRSHAQRPVGRGYKSLPRRP